MIYVQSVANTNPQSLIFCVHVQESEIKVVSEQASRTTNAPSVQNLNLQKDSEIGLSIKSLYEETRQLLELSEIERTHTNEVTSILKGLIKAQNTAFKIKELPALKLDDPDSSLLTLTPEGSLVVVGGNGATRSLQLETLPSESVISILAEVLPQIKSRLSEERQQTTMRVTTLEKIAREFRKISSTFDIRRKEVSLDNANAGIPEHKQVSSSVTSNSSISDAKNVLGHPQETLKSVS